MHKLGIMFKLIPWKDLPFDGTCVAEGVSADIPNKRYLRVFRVPIPNLVCLKNIGMAGRLAHIILMFISMQL